MAECWNKIVNILFSEVLGESEKIWLLFLFKNQYLRIHIYVLNKRLNVFLWLAVLEV